MKAMFVRFWVIVSLLFCAVTAHAQQQQPVPTGPLMGSEASPLPVTAASGIATGFGGADGVFRILVVGDNLAGGVGAGMSRMVQDDPRYDIVNRFNESSGLSRTEFYDWPNAIEKIVADRPVDAVVVLVGVNDRQEIRKGNIRYPFKSPDWLVGYNGNVDRLLAAIKAANALPIWVSIPPMADPVFDADMRYLSEIHAKRVVAQAGFFIDVRPNFVAAGNSYTDRGPDDAGNIRKLRDSDGINFMKVGNNRLGQLVLAEINRLALGTPVAPMPVPPVVSSNVASTKTIIPVESAQGETVETGYPSFGQDGLDGEQITFRADAIQPSAKGRDSLAQRSAMVDAATVPEVRLTAKPRSQAQSLFSNGIASDAPAGRFDDFTVPALP